MHILTIDIGTSSIKAGVISRSGRLIGWAREGVSIDSGHDGTPGLATRWLEAIMRIIAKLSARTRIDAVAVSGNGPTVVPVSDASVPVGPTLMWCDSREMRIEGHRSFYLPKIAWFRKTFPEAYESTRWLIPCPEFIILALTGNAVTINPSEEFTRFIWNRDSIEAYGIDPAKLPPFVRTGERVGTVTDSAASKFSLTPGLPVFAGGSDYLMCLLGTATTVPGRTCDRAGTSEGINHCSETAVDNPRLRTLPHLVPGLYNVAGILSSTGRIFEWFRRVSGQHEKSYDKMLSEISRVPSDASRPIFLPSIRTGVTWEFSGAAFTGIEPYHGIEEMGRAVVDSIGFSIRGLIETLEASGCDVHELRASGGQARNSVWNQMKANMTGRPIVVPEVIDAELLGNAAAALYGMGEHDSLAGAGDDLYQPVRRYEPEYANAAELDAEYLRFCDARNRIVERLEGAGPNQD